MTERRQNPVPQGKEGETPAHTAYPGVEGNAGDAKTQPPEPTEQSGEAQRRSGKGAHTPAIGLDPPGFTGPQSGTVRCRGHRAE